MQRLEAKIEAKIGNIKGELLELVDEDFQEKRAKINQEFAAKAEAKAAAAAAAAAAAEVKAKDEVAEAETAVVPTGSGASKAPTERSTAATGIEMEER